MIPTRYRGRPPGHLTDPTGAEALSQALEGMPHGEELSISFFRVALGWYGETWELTVYPVLRPARHLATPKPGEEGS